MFGLVPFERKGRGLQRRNGDYFDIDSIFENFFNDAVLPSFFSKSNQMRVDISENDKEYILEAELPGVKKEEINLEVHDDRLTISVNRDESNEERKDNYLRRERRTSSMVRSFSIENVVSDKITAKHENGILTLVLPKKEETKPKGRKIDIS
ncbi:MAG: Hsp20/alpha crystallin family protein [Clostridia bacterium]|nr:Hsp20/alpha crystallin family protein [Clostridia bacterium]